MRLCRLSHERYIIDTTLCFSYKLLTFCKLFSKLPCIHAQFSGFQIIQEYTNKHPLEWGIFKHNVFQQQEGAELHLSTGHSLIIEVAASWQTNLTN